MNSADKPDPLPPEQPASEQPASEQPASEQPVPEQPLPEPPVVEREKLPGGSMPSEPIASRGDENPYAAPLEGRWVEQAAGGITVGSDLRAPSAPWSGGWGLMVLVVGLLSGLGIAIAIQVDDAGIGGLLIPICGLGLIAVLVRFLHGSVDVEWPIYLLISAGFGVVSYFAFIPVCIVVGIPVMIVMGQVAEHRVTLPVAIFAMVLVCGLIFTFLLRLYLKHRYRKQWFDKLTQLSPSASEAIVPGDPYAAPRDPR